MQAFFLPDFSVVSMSLILLRLRTAALNKPIAEAGKAYPNQKFL